MHISESYFLKIFPHHRRGQGMPPPTPSPFSAAMRACPRFTCIVRPPPTFKVAPKPIFSERYIKFQFLASEALYSQV